jgi:hypothetical protein
MSLQTDQDAKTTKRKAAIAAALAAALMPGITVAAGPTDTPTTLAGPPSSYPSPPF